MHPDCADQPSHLVVSEECNRQRRRVLQFTVRRQTRVSIETANKTIVYTMTVRRDQAAGKRQDQEAQALLVYLGQKNAIISHPYAPSQMLNRSCFTLTPPPPNIPNHPTTPANGRGASVHQQQHQHLLSTTALQRDGQNSDSKKETREKKREDTVKRVREREEKRNIIHNDSTRVLT